MITDYRVLDREFRDYTAELKYPFSDDAVLGALDGLTVPASLFLDALLYLPSSVNMPIYLSEIVEGDDENEAFAVFRDDLDIEVARCVLRMGEDSSMITRNGVEAGTVVYDGTAVGQLVRASHGYSLFFGRNLPICQGRCLLYDPKGLTAITADGAAAYRGVVFVAAASGMRFDEDPDDQFSVRLHMLGEEPPESRPVLSINSLGRDKMWFAAAPNSGVKIETVENGLKFWSIADE